VGIEKDIKKLAKKLSLVYNMSHRWADTIKNPKDLPELCAGGWQAA